MPAKATQTRENGVLASIKAVIVKKCDRALHRPETNKGCASGTCQHTTGSPKSFVNQVS